MIQFKRFILLQIYTYIKKKSVLDRNASMRNVFLSKLIFFSKTFFSSHYSGNSNERQFLKDFVGAVPGSSGERVGCQYFFNIKFWLYKLLIFIF